MSTATVQWTWLTAGNVL